MKIINETDARASIIHKSYIRKNNFIFSFKTCSGIGVSFDIQNSRFKKLGFHWKNLEQTSNMRTKQYWKMPYILNQY